MLHPFYRPSAMHSHVTGLGTTQLAINRPRTGPRHAQNRLAVRSSADNQVGFPCPSEVHRHPPLMSCVWHPCRRNTI